MTTRKKKTAGATGGEKENGEKAKAGKALKKNANAIVESLIEGVKSGDGKSSRLLMELPEGEVSAKEPLMERPALTLAARLAAEPQWPIDLSEEDWDEDVDAEMEVEGKETVTV